MKMAKGDVRRCTNPGCDCEIHLITGACAEANRHPICCCGSVLKKSYRRPAFKTTDRKDSGGLKGIYALELA